MPRQDELIDWLYGLKGPSLKWDLDTARALNAACGHPDRAFRSLHVAGTNGKGSVAAMAHAIALAGGIRAGLYTSPHLVRPEERIRIGAEEIDPVEFRALVARLRALAERELSRGALPRAPSFFEIATSAAFLAFAGARVGFAAVECGLGGRLDATNVIHPLATVVTTVGLDHAPILGPTIAAIAREKAGIVKPGIPVLAGWLPDEALATVEARARRVGAPFSPAARELSIVDGPDGTFSVSTPERTYEALACPLAGAHQRRNAALAIRALELCRARGLPLPPEAVRAGLARVRWPGRLERIGGRAGEVAYLLDAAHNAEGAAALAEWLGGRDAAGEGRPRVALFGLTEGRSAAEIAAPLARSVDAWIVTRPEIDKAIDPSAVAAELASLVDAPVEVIPAPAEALARARAQIAARADRPGQGEILVTGSLYLVGDARRILLRLDGPGHPPRETRLPAAGEAR